MQYARGSSAYCQLLTAYYYILGITHIVQY